MATERRMTVEDWKALYLAQRLVDAIALHGKEQLDQFIDAMVAMRSSTRHRRPA